MKSLASGLVLFLVDEPDGCAEHGQDDGEIVLDRVFRVFGLINIGVRSFRETSESKVLRVREVSSGGAVDEC